MKGMMCMSKTEIRNYILSVKDYVKLASVCREFGLSRSSMNLFLKGIDNAISQQKLNEIVNFIQNL